MTFDKIAFDAKDVIKLIGFTAFMVSMWADLKSEQIQAREERKFIQYQINELKTSKQFAAILPKQTKIESE